jgi:hypothetical protein
MSKIVKLRPDIANLAIEANDMVDTSPPAMKRLEKWQAARDDVAETQIKKLIAERAIKKGVDSTVQLLRQQIKELLACKAINGAL